MVRRLASEGQTKRVFERVKWYSGFSKQALIRSLNFILYIIFNQSINSFLRHNLSVSRIYRLRIVSSNYCSAFLLGIFRHFPGFMNVLCR